MQTLDELKAEQAKALAKLEKEHALAAAAPVPPDRVQLTSAGLGDWLTYKVANLWEAIDLLAKCQPVTFYEWRGSCTRFVPEALNVGKYAAAEPASGPYVVKLDVHQGEGFGPTVSLQWFIRIGEGFAMCRADLERERFGGSSFGQFGAHFIANPRGRSRRLDGNRYVQGDFRANSKLNGFFDKVTYWGSGTAESCHLQYSLCADYEGPEAAAGYHEAMLRLANVAEAMNGPRPLYRFKFDSGKMTGHIVRLSDGRESPELDKDSSWSLYQKTSYGGGMEALNEAGDSIQWGD